MSNNDERVLSKLISQCSRAFHAHTPLIVVDTDEIELMDRLAEQSRLVDLVAQKSHIEDRHIRYYEYVGAQPRAIDLSDNFSYDPATLEELIQHGGMDCNKPPKLLVLQLINENVSVYSSLIDTLRRYVQAYVRCRDNASALRSNCVFLYGDPSLLPKDLRIYSEVFTPEYPKVWEIAEILDRIVEESDVLNKTGERMLENRQKIAESMAGFGLIEAERFIWRIIEADAVNGKRVIFDPAAREEMLLDAKEQAVRRAGGILQLYREEKVSNEEKESNAKKDSDNDKLGGMKRLKGWVDDADIRMEDSSKYARTRGVPALKGVLLCGVPGCGKSETVKVIHRKWGLPMLRLDVDRLMGGLVGDSERNMRQALAQAEAMAPCILWIDELEKGFSGAASESRDGGTFKRMFGRLLTWMQENQKPCFICATANDISNLPPEFFRSGRFDVLFSFYMPTNDECKEIFAEQMRRADKLRRDKAKELGSSEKDIKPLFNEDSQMGCFTDRALQNIMNLFTEKKNPEHPEGIKFLTGADIRKITSAALTRLPAEKLNKPLEESDWIDVLSKVVSDSAITTLGSSNASLDMIAANYVRLMRQNFVPVSEDRQLLFKKENYKCEYKDDMNTGKVKVIAKYDGGCTLSSPYDRALFNALHSRIERIAGMIESTGLLRISQ